MKAAQKLQSFFRILGLIGEFPENVQFREYLNIIS